MKHGDGDPVPEVDLRRVAERCKAQGRTVELLPDEILSLLDIRDAKQAVVKAAMDLSNVWIADALDAQAYKNAVSAFTKACAALRARKEQT